MRWILCFALLLASCKGVFGSGSGEPETPVAIYGVGKMPDEPPDSCKFVEKVEVTQLEDKTLPIKKFEAEARNRDANAVAYIRKDGIKDGYLGKNYRFVGSIYECPVPRAPMSASVSASVSASAMAH